MTKIFLQVFSTRTFDNFRFVNIGSFDANSGEGTVIWSLQKIAACFMLIRAGSVEKPHLGGKRFWNIENKPEEGHWYLCDKCIIFCVRFIWACWSEICKTVTLDSWEFTLWSSLIICLLNCELWVVGCYTKSSVRHPTRIPCSSKEGQIHLSVMLGMFHSTHRLIEGDAYRN